MLYRILLYICPDANDQWSMTIVVKYEFGANQVFGSIWIGSHTSVFESHLNERKANREAEPGYVQLTHQDIHFDILNDAPSVNMINLTDGSRDYRQLPANYSPRLLGMSRDGSILYVIGIERGTCQSHHELKVVLFATFKCEPGKGIWCKDPVGPFTLTTDVPCSEKLPRLAITPIRTGAMIVLDTDRTSPFLNCILVERNQPPCNLDGVLPKNRFENRYFFNTSSQETLMQVQLMDSFSQYVINQDGLIRQLHFSNSAEQNPPCPMLSPSLFNCTAGMKFMNGTKLVHLSGAVGEPQSFQWNGANGVTYVRQTRGESAVLVRHPSLSGGIQVLDNSTWVCRHDTAVKPLYVLKDGYVIVVALCFPNGERLFHVYLYQVKEERYILLPTRQPLRLGGRRFGEVLNVLLIGEPFLVQDDTTPTTTIIPPDGHSVPASTSASPTETNVAGSVAGSIMLAFLIISTIVTCCICQRKKGISRRMNEDEDRLPLIDISGHEGPADDEQRGNQTNGSPPLDSETELELTFMGEMALGGAQNRASFTRDFRDCESPNPCAPTNGPIQVIAELHPECGNRNAQVLNRTHGTAPVPLIPETRTGAPTPPTGPEVTTPSTGPVVRTPPTRLEVTTPSTGPEVTTQSTGLEVTTPSTGSEVTTPSTRLEVTTTTTISEVTTPTTSSEITTPSTGPEVTTPSTRPEVTTPTTSSEVTTPSTGPEVIPLQTGADSAPSREVTQPPVSGALGETVDHVIKGTVYIVVLCTSLSRTVSYTKST